MSGAKPFMRSANEWVKSGEKKYTRIHCKVVMDRNKQVVMGIWWKMRIG